MSGDLETFRWTELSRKVLRSLVPVICPPEARGLADAIVDHMALTLGASPRLLQSGMQAGLLGYDLGALPFHGRRAHKLTGDRAERYFTAWEDGITPMQVQLARGLNQLMSLACYEQPEMMARVGYNVGPWMDEVTHKRLTVFKDDVRKQADQILAADPLRPGVTVAALRTKTQKETA